MTSTVTLEGKKQKACWLAVWSGVNFNKLWQLESLPIYRLLHLLHQF